MTIPSRLNSNTPIPNQPFSYPQTRVLLGIDPENGTLSLSGSTPPEPLCDYPPYFCNTNVNTSCVEDFSNAWFDCSSLTSFPPLDTSSGTNFMSAWSLCTSLTTFPTLNVSNGTTFQSAWGGCTSLTSFPAAMFDSCLTTDFTNTWTNCALSQESVDNILVSLDTAGGTNGIVHINEGTSSEPSYEGWQAVSSLQEKGWTVYVNGTPPIPTTPCTLQFTNLTPTSPPFSCNVEVNTSGVTSFSSAWYNCFRSDSYIYNGYTYQFENVNNVTEFPCLNTGSGVTFTFAWANSFDLTFFPLLDTSSGTNFSHAWYNCSGLTSFPAINTGSGTNFYAAWYNCSGLTSFPLIDTSSGTTFTYSWRGCSFLTTFPAGMFNNCPAINFQYAWQNCALSQQSVDNILISLNVAGQSGGVVHLNGGISAAPSATGLAAKAALQSRGWTIFTN